MPATVWLAFMVTVKAGVFLPLPVEKTAAAPSTQAPPVLPPAAVLHFAFSHVWLNEAVVPLLPLPEYE